MQDLPNGLGAGSTELYVLRAYNNIVPNYIYAIIKSKGFLRKGQSSMRGVTGIKRVPRQFVKNLVISLPPLSEQKRIVEKLDKLMNYCDKLESSIKESKALNERLLQQVLRETFSNQPHSISTSETEPV